MLNEDWLNVSNRAHPNVMGRWTEREIDKREGASAGMIPVNGKYGMENVGMISGCNHQMIY